MVGRTRRLPLAMPRRELSPVQAYQQDEEAFVRPELALEFGFKCYSCKTCQLAHNHYAQNATLQLKACDGLISTVDFLFARGMRKIGAALLLV